MYIIQAIVNGVQIPMFFLDENIQGIINERHAEMIARSVLNPLNEKDKQVWVYAEKASR